MTLICLVIGRSLWLPLLLRKQTCWSHGSCAQWDDPWSQPELQVQFHQCVQSCPSCSWWIWWWNLLSLPLCNSRGCLHTDPTAFIFGRSLWVQSKTYTGLWGHCCRLIFLCSCCLWCPGYCLVVVVIVALSILVGLWVVSSFIDFHGCLKNFKFSSVFCYSVPLVGSCGFIEAFL